MKLKKLLAAVTAAALAATATAFTELTASAIEDVALSTGSLGAAELVQDEWSGDSFALPSIVLDSSWGNPKPFKGFRALEVDYTFTNMYDTCLLYLVAQGGTVPNGFYLDYDVAYTCLTADSCNTISMALAELQDCTYEQLAIQVHPLGDKYNVGDVFDPGLTVLSSSLKTYPGDCAISINTAKKYKYMQVTYRAPLINECADPNHFGEDGVDYGAGCVYCPWAGCFAYGWNSKYAYRPNMENYYMGFGDPEEYVTGIVKVSDVISSMGDLSNIDSIAFEGWGRSDSVSVELFNQKSDLDLGIGSIDTTTIKEAMIYDDPTGEPDINSTIRLVDKRSKTDFEDYAALKIDYTIENIDEVEGMIVILTGWGDNGIGYLKKFFAAEKDGTIAIDLSGYQDKAYHIIEVGPVAKRTSQIGDSFSPKFTVTGAHVLTSYSGAITPEIDPILPGKAEEPEVPENPVIPSGAPTSNADAAENSTAIPVGGSSETTAEQAIETINNAKEGAEIKISISGNTSISKGIIAAIAGKDTDVQFDLPGGVTVEINGLDIENAKKVDLGVRMNKNKIDKEKINEIAGDKKTIQFTLKHNGDFGFKATFNLPVNKKYNGKFANIYWDNHGKLEYVGSSKIVNGRASYVTTHASDYVIVVDDYAYGEDVSSAAKFYADDDIL